MVTFKVCCVEYNVLLKLISCISCHFLNCLICLFLVVLGLRCMPGLSLVVVRGLLSSCSVQASHCSGFSCCRGQALGTRASVVAALGLSSHGAWA